MKKAVLTFVLVSIAYCSFAQWTTSGTNIYNSNTGNVGIGTTSPLTKLHILGGEIRLAGQGASGLTSTSFISFYDSNNTTRYGWLGDGSVGSNDITLWADAGIALHFATNGVTDRMFISTAGNVGIGTNTPSSPLEIAGPSVVGGASNTLFLLNPSNTFNAGAAIVFGGPLDIYSTGSVRGSLVTAVSGGTGKLILGSRSGGVSNDEVTLYGGNVGIGTATPAGKLQVRQGTSYDLLTSTTTVDIGVSGLAGGWARSFRVVNTSGSNGQDGGAFGVVGSGATPVFAYMSIPTADATGYSSTKLLMLDNSGNVGIGTTNTQGYKFAVNGTAIATAMTVQLYANWPEQKQEADHEKEQVRQLQEQVLNLSKALLKK